MSNTRIGVLSLAVAIALALTVQSAAAQPLTERERTLLEKVDTLEKRVADLERSQAAGQAVRSVKEDQSRVQLENRVSEIEEKIDQDASSAATDFRVFWKEGLRFESGDGNFKLRVGGRIQNDWAWYNQDDSLKWPVGDEQDGTEFRRARIYLQGDIYEDIFYKAQYDFASDNPTSFKDVYVGLKNVPHVGKLTLGHRKEPFGLEQLTSSKYITFMERSLADAFTPGRNVGAMISNDALDERITWALGVWKDVDDWPSSNDSDEDQGVAFTARLTGLPWYEDDGRKLLHLGVAYSHRNPDGANYRFRERPESHLANRYVNTDGFVGFRTRDGSVDGVDLWGFESALVYGPFSLQGEYMLADVDTEFAGNPDFDGYYLQASYFLTGENRRYKQSSAAFDRVKLNNNFSPGSGNWGAWEVALRYSSIDLNDGIIRGGEEDNWTAALNWYLNPNTRVMLNYILADVEHDLYEGDLDILQCRFQVDF